VSSVISSSLFEKMLLHRGFYTYDAFIAAAKSFPAFATTGSTDVRKREVAAFLAQTSHETTGGWPTAPDGPYELGSTSDYFGRGPIQISYNYNYGAAGKAIGVDLLRNPDLVTSDNTVEFKTALWFWMTPQSPKPSSHDVITGRWSPSSTDKAAGRVPGYGVLTNIIDGGVECGKGQESHVADRIGYYKDNLDCYNQKPFA
uniref:Endochitinase (Fragments) n=1 Tax=Avena sativa TaxID=4498 RepID=CHIT_AVESA|nr:RecName: Full=Endochitinase [Avena sativa]